MPTLTEVVSPVASPKSTLRRLQQRALAASPHHNVLSPASLPGSAKRLASAISSWSFYFLDTIIHLFEEGENNVVTVWANFVQSFLVHPSPVIKDKLKTKKILTLVSIMNKPNTLSFNVLSF